MDFESISLTLTLCVAATLLLLERRQNSRRQTISIRYRWLTNIGLMLCGGIAASLLFSEDAITVAGQVQGGLLGRWSLPPVVEMIAVFLLLDFWRYWEHRIYHEVPLLWRVHLVHHSDTHLDITTAERHHPIEAMLAVCTMLLLVFSLGISAQALAFYVAVASLSALVTHANIVLPETIDRLLRGWLVTPSVHAFHHSESQPQTDSNYGSVLSFWDRLFGTYTDPATQQVHQFGLEYFHLAEDRALGPVLLQPFEYTRGMDYPQRDAIIDDHANSTSVVVTDKWRRALFSMSVGLLLALIALWPTVSSLARVWSNSEPYQYAWTVFPMFVYLVGWFYRDRLLAMTPRPDLLGLLVILVAVLLWLAAHVVDIQVGQHLALVLILQGLVLSAVGRAIFLQFLPVMALLLFMVPCGDLLQPFLRDLTVKWIEWLALLMQAPVRIDGFMAYVGDHRYVVIDACSGLTFVTLAAFLGYSFGLMLFRSFGQVLALSALGAVIGVLTNALRVWMIVGIDWVRGTQLDMDAHMDLQWLALFVALGVLFYCVMRLQTEDKPEAPARASPDSPGNWRGARWAPVLAGLIVVVTVLPVQGSFARTGQGGPATPLEQASELYPESQWLSSDSSRDRALLFAGKNGLQFVLSEPMGQGDRPNKARLYPKDTKIWRHAGTTRLSTCKEDHCVEFIHETWRRKGSDNSRHTAYTYFVGDTFTPSKLHFRLARGWDRLLGADKPVGVIGLRIRGDLPEADALSVQFFEVWSSLQNH